MARISVTTVIPASPEEVWAVLADTSSHPDWNPFIRRFEGTLAVGERLVVTLGAPGRRGMTFRPTVLDAEPGRRLAWLGHLGVRGLFDGLHSFDLRELTDGSTELVHSEEFSGLLVRALASTLKGTAEGFAAMNDALAAEVAKRRTAVVSGA